MMDREKVIKELEERIKVAEECMGNPMFTPDAIRTIVALLKEQEPVKPVNVRLEMGINGGNCPKCMNWVQRSYNYCPFCGRKVKWND